MRLIAGYGAVACASPYLVLKIVWLSGGDLGVADPVMMRDASMVALNAITAVMDVVGIAIALAFTHRWGLRVPAWILLPPMWVATGLLSTFVVGTPLTALLSAWTSDAPARAAGGPVQPWVYIMVYTGFAGLGIGLMAAFTIYARTRWADAVTGPIAVGARGAAYRVQAPLANAAALIAGALSALHLAWACGASVGLSTEAAAERTIVSTVLNALNAATMACGAAGVLMMVHRIGRRTPFWLALALTWLGSGSLFAWGLWQLIVVLGQTALAQRTDRSALVNLAALFRLIAGLVIGIVMLFVLAERTQGRRLIEEEAEPV